MLSLAEIAKLLKQPAALPAKGGLPGPPGPILAPARKRRALRIVEEPPAERGEPGHAAQTKAAVRRERALALRAQYSELVYDFAPSASHPACDPFSYDHVIVAFSGGKDSLACLLLLLELGVPRDRIELWHHEVDGGEGSTLMDWPCTPDYCRAIAEALGVALYRSWKVGGYEGELLREDAQTAATRFEVPGGKIREGGGKDPNRSTRMRFPQKAADLKVRWCSGALKIDVMSLAIRNQDRFERPGVRTLVITGERGEESPNRAKYEVLEPDRTNLEKTGARVVDHWRPILHWPEPEVWKIIEKYRIASHPAYELGWGRVSCAACIFGSPNQWASLRVVNPEQFEQVAAFEAKFDRYWKGRTVLVKGVPKVQQGATIDRDYTVGEMADMGTPFTSMDERHIRAATSRAFHGPVFVKEWVLPSGAILGDGTGPT